MKNKELYQFNVWGKNNFALLLPYEKERIEYQNNNEGVEKEILTIRTVDGTLIPAASISKIINAREIKLEQLVSLLKEFFPNKLASLNLNKNGNIINSESNKFGLTKISTHDCLYSYLFGNKMYVYEKTVKVKAEITAVIDAEIEVPAGCNILDYTEYVKKNKNFLKVNDIDYVIDDLSLSL